MVDFKSYHAYTMHLKWKLFPLSKLHEIKPFKVALTPPLMDELTSFGQREFAPAILGLY